MDVFGLLSNFLIEHGYLAVFIVLLLCGLGIPIPEELTLIAAGFAVYAGRAELAPMIAVTIVGILVGDSILFWWGRRYGPQLLSKALFRKLLHAERMSKVRDQFDRHGVKAVFFARFFAGIRACVFFSAGTLGMRYRTFVLLDLLGALLSAPISVWLGMRFGAQIENLLRYMTKVDRALLALAVGFVAWTVGRALWQRYRRVRQATPGVRRHDAA